MITSRKLDLRAGIGLVYLLGMLDIVCQGYKLSKNSLFFQLIIFEPPTMSFPLVSINSGFLAY